MASFEPPKLQDPSRQIRLLRLLPGDDLNEVQCLLDIYNLDDDLRYAAISYVWGPESPLYNISINGSIVQVRFNCWYAMRQIKLRRAIHESGCQYRPGPFPDLVWIDSICIDQVSPTEKSLQVARMGDIYSQAQVVAMCIGQQGWDKLLFHQCQCSSGLAFSSDDAAAELSQMQLSDSAGPRIEHFARRDYFFRLWTVQELLLAKSLEVLCGHGRNSWSELTQHLQRHPNESLRNRKSITNTDTMEQVVQLMKDRDQDYLGISGFGTDQPIQRAQFTLPNTIVRYGRRECSELLDKVYGFLSLTPTAVQQHLLPDYSISLLHVLLKVACIYPKLGLGGIEYERDTGMTQKGSMGYILSAVGLLADEFSASEEFMAELAELLCVDGSESWTDRVDVEVYGTYFRIGAKSGDRLSLLDPSGPHNASEGKTMISAELAEQLGFSPESTVSNFAWLLEASSDQDEGITLFTRSSASLNTMQLGFAIPTAAQAGDIIVTIRFSVPTDSPDDSDDVMYIVCRETGTAQMDILGLAKPFREVVPDHDGRISGIITMSAEQLLAIALLHQNPTNCTDLPRGVAQPPPWLRINRRRAFTLQGTR